jgi:hypothetical protein
VGGGYGLGEEDVGLKLSGMLEDSVVSSLLCRGVFRRNWGKDRLFRRECLKSMGAKKLRNPIILTGPRIGWLQGTERR